MITVALTTRIAASPEEVWHALANPAERRRWDERILGAVNRPAPLRPRPAESIGAPSALRQLRWRFLLAGLPQILREEVLIEQRFHRIISRIGLASLRADQTVTLVPEEDASGAHTRLSMKLSACNRLPILGELSSRSVVQRIVLEYIDATLRQIKKHCER